MRKMITKLEQIIKDIIIEKMHMKFLEKKWDIFFQIFKFLIGGGISAIITYFVYSLSLIVIRETKIVENYDYIVSQFLAFVISVFWSFIWNNWIVFAGEKRNKKIILKNLIKTYILYSFTSLFLSSILLYLWVQILNISEFVAPIINIIICVPLNYFLNKVWAFKRNKEGENNE